MFTLFLCELMQVNADYDGTEHFNALTWFVFRNAKCMTLEQINRIGPDF